MVGPEVHGLRAWSLAAIGICHFLLVAGCDQQSDSHTAAKSAPVPNVAEFVGGEACIDCHDEQHSRWKNSHHDLAMQDASEATVLGDFDSAQFTYNGMTSEFYRRGESFWVRTDDSDGNLTEFEITHTFGIEPLQQYLVAMPAGNVQVLSLAWDTRTAGEGGQRWFHLYPDEAIDNDDPLHWTGVFQSWNSTCAGCHSTNLRKNYSPADHAFATAYSSIDVDCESCHGPGSSHAADPDNASMVLAGEPEARWVFRDSASIAERNPARSSDTEIETCAQCHSRRGQLIDEFKAGAPLMDAFRPALLQEGLYYADGQILDEVYVYGSFLQSKMYQAGVSCKDCHDSHSAELRLDGNAVCAQCHRASAYDVPDHHHHEAGTVGFPCVDCHMPAKNYMVVDPRRDHSFRVPRPDLSEELDVPNACTGCHQSESDAWAAGTVASWYPDGRNSEPHYGQDLAAGRSWARDRAPRLLRLLDDETAPDIVRATAVSLLAEQLDDAAFNAISHALDNASPLIQLAALEALSGVPAELGADLARRFLTHPLRGLRLAAARLLAPARLELTQSQRADLDAALDEYRHAQAFNSDRAQGLLNLAGLEADLGDPKKAETLLKAAIEREPYFVASHINLADLYRRSGREAEAMVLLDAAVESNPEDPAGYFAQGLALVRDRQSAEALEKFQRTIELAPDAPYYHYVKGVALHSTGQQELALAALLEAHQRFPGYREIVFTLATIYRDAGNAEESLRFARELLVLSPNDPAAIALISEMQSR